MSNSSNSGPVIKDSKECSTQLQDIDHLGCIDCENVPLGVKNVTKVEEIGRNATLYCLTCHICKAEYYFIKGNSHIVNMIQTW